MDIRIGLLFYLRPGVANYWFQAVSGHQGLTLDEAVEVLREYMTGDIKTRKAIACSGFMVSEDRTRSFSIEIGALSEDYDIRDQLLKIKAYWIDNDEMHQ